MAKVAAFTLLLLTWGAVAHAGPAVPQGWEPVRWGWPTEEARSALVLDSAATSRLIVEGCHLTALDLWLAEGEALAVEKGASVWVVDGNTIYQSERVLVATDGTGGTVYDSTKECFKVSARSVPLRLDKDGNERWLRVYLEWPEPVNEIDSIYDLRGMKKVER